MGLLLHYGVELQHLNPNGIQHVVAFVALCEGFAGVPPHWDLWTYFFRATIIKRTGGVLAAGSCSLHLCGGRWNSRVAEYIKIPLTDSNRGWNDEWFYLKNDHSKTRWRMLHPGRSCSRSRKGRGKSPHMTPKCYRRYRGR